MFSKWIYFKENEINILKHLKQNLKYIIQMSLFFIFKFSISDKIVIKKIINYMKIEATTVWQNKINFKINLFFWSLTIIL